MHAIAEPRDVTLQLELEELYDKNQLMPRIRAEFENCKEIDFKASIKGMGIPLKFGIDLLAQMAIRKRANLHTLVGSLRHHFRDGQSTANALEKAAAGNLVDYWDKDKIFVVLYEISEDVQRQLDLFQYPLPMIIRPKTVETNLDTGYLTGRGSVILRDNHTDDDVCLDHINRMNSMELAINLDTAKTIHNKWRGLDKKKIDESWDDFQKRRKAFEKYDSTAKDVISLLIQEGNRIYLTHRYDKRGRTYCMGHHVTYQGTDWNKAVLEFANKEELLEG